MSFRTRAFRARPSLSPAARASSARRWCATCSTRPMHSSSTSTSSLTRPISIRSRRRRAIAATRSSASTSATPPRCAGCSRPTGPTPCSISPPRPMSTARSTGRRSSSRPMWSAPSRCCRRRCATGTRSRRRQRDRFRFLHVSTDEVFGSLGASGQFTETTAYAPNSPYSASKACVRSSGARLARDLRAADHHHQLARTITGRISFRKS